MMRNRDLLLWDILSQPLIVVAAFSLRLERIYPTAYQDQMLGYSLLSALIIPTIYYLMGMYRRIWRYAGTDEAELIATSSVVGSLITAIVVFLIAIPLDLMARVPRSIPFITTLLTMMMAALPRYAKRIVHQHYAADGKAKPKGRPTRVLIVGAGDAGNMVLREMLSNPQLGYRPVGFVDDDPTKHNLQIRGCRVLGSTSDIPDLVRLHRIERLLIAMPSAGGQTIRDIMQKAAETRVQVLTLPGVYELLTGEVSVSRLRPIRVEDLLRREPVEIDRAQVETLIHDRCVLVTGGGGSIGSEICRQVARCGPARLIVLGHGENSIYQIGNELLRQHPDLALECVVADIRDAARLDQVFCQYRPDIVLHAAAHKHVPLMEANMPDAVTNNIQGTRILVEKAVAHGTSRLVMISSDKAVNPTSVMGVTKRVAEMIVQDAAYASRRAFTTVRFGNVLGSRGSVVPLFESQIAAGGPVTVTHTDVRRYFMTIPEAVQLVLQAAALGNGGEIFVLDMGESIRIIDLARDMITLSGLKPDEDIEIAIVGMRPGEKLFEELSVRDERHMPSPHEKIFVLRQDRGYSAERSATLHARVDELFDSAQTGDLDRLQQVLHDLVPEYVSPEEVNPALN